MFHDGLAFAGVQFDHRRERLRPAVGVDKLLGAHQPEEGEQGVFSQYRQISRRFVAHSKESSLEEVFFRIAIG